MTELTASRTLVKSPPELWAECSDAGSLSRHLDQFGEIRITRLEPETAVAWEGEHASGTVRLEPAGWGTRVVLTAVPAAGEVAASEPPVTPPPPEAGELEPPVAVGVEAPEPAASAPLVPLAACADPARRGLMARMRAWLNGAGRVSVEPEPRIAQSEEAESRSEAVAPEPESNPEPPPEPEGSALDPESALIAALDSLGQAHHRPFSRA